MYPIRDAVDRLTTIRSAPRTVRYARVDFAPKDGSHLTMRKGTVPSFLLESGAVARVHSL